jgi:hypothetical protein
MSNATADRSQRHWIGNGLLHSSGASPVNAGLIPESGEKSWHAPDLVPDPMFSVAAKMLIGCLEIRYFQATI